MSSDTDSFDEAFSECEQLRIRRAEGQSYRTITEKTGVGLVKVLQHVLGGCNCPVSTPPRDARDDEPWLSEFVVRSLYREKEMRFTQMSKVLDCHPETAKKYVDKFDISPIDSSNRTSSPQVNRLLRKGAEDDDIKIQ